MRGHRLPRAARRREIPRSAVRRMRRAAPRSHAASGRAPRAGGLLSRNGDAPGPHALSSLPLWLLNLPFVQVSFAGNSSGSCGRGAAAHVNGPKGLLLPDFELAFAGELEAGREARGRERAALGRLAQIVAEKGIEAAPIVHRAQKPGQELTRFVDRPDRQLLDAIGAVADEFLPALGICLEQIEKVIGVVAMRL